MNIGKNITTSIINEKNVLKRTLILSLILILLSGFMAVQATTSIDLAGRHKNNSTSKNSSGGWIRTIAEGDKPQGTSIVSIELVKDGGVSVYKVTFSDGSVKMYDANTGMPYYKAGSSEEQVASSQSWDDDKWHGEDYNRKSWSKNRTSIKVSVKQRFENNEDKYEYEYDYDDDWEDSDDEDDDDDDKFREKFEKRYRKFIERRGRGRADD